MKSLNHQGHDHENAQTTLPTLETVESRPSSDPSLDRHGHTYDQIDSSTIPSQDESRIFSFDVGYRDGKPIINVFDAHSHTLLRQVPITQLQALKDRLHDRVGFFIDDRI
jgi:uncharacterized FlaG/YvyC family protein